MSTRVSELKTISKDSELDLTHMMETNDSGCKTATWYVDQGSGGQGLVIDAVDGRSVCVAYAAADAPLLAAAPSLMTILTDLMGLWDREDVADEWDQVFRDAQRVLEGLNSGWAGAAIDIPAGSVKVARGDSE